MSRLFIVNTLSERVSKKGSTLEKIASETKTPLCTLNPFDALPAAVSDAAQSEVTHVIIEGGDGTVQGVITEFLKQADKFQIFPNFSIIPGGMTNQVAKNIGFKSASKIAVEAALVRNLTAIETPLLEVVDGEGPRYAGFLFSSGAVPQITRYATGKLHKKGIGGSLAVLGGILKGIRGDDETLMQTTPIKLDGLYSGNHFGTLITTLPGLILGLDPFWGDGNAPLRVTFADDTYRGLARNILSLWMGNKSKDRSRDGLYSTNTDQLAFEYHGDIVLDGEFLSIPSGKFTIQTTPAVTFLR